MHVLSTVDAWLDVAHLDDADERVTAWRTTYEAQHPSVFEVYYRSWGAADRRAEAARSAPTLVEVIRRAEARAVDVLRRAEHDFHRHGLLEGEDLHVVLLVGGRSSNGWVTEHEGRSTLFLALEYLGEPPYDELLILHEMAHVAQRHLSPDARSARYPTAFGVVVEGAAVTATRLLRPGRSDSAYLWMDDDHHDWVSQCEEDAGGIARLVLDHLDTADDDDAVAPLFRNRDGGRVPARAAYWAGDQVARALIEAGRDLPAVLSMGAQEARDVVARWAAGLR